MDDKFIANFCLAWVCVGWPFVWALAAYNIGKYGLLGWIGNIGAGLRRTFVDPFRANG